METMINLTDLLKREILDLYSVEEQIIEALPKMVEKAKNPELKKALREHLKVTEQHKSRLDKVKQTFGEDDNQDGHKGFFSRLFGGGSGGEKCKGMAGIISEGEKIMNADIADEALDAAIIASAQKVEHYEICGYGTARAYARELKMAEVEQLLTQTLKEEYAADDLLTSLAVGRLNIAAEQADGMSDGKGKNIVTATNGMGKASAEKKSSKSGSTSKPEKLSASTKNKSKNNSSKIATTPKRRSGASKGNAKPSDKGARGGSKSAKSNSSKSASKSSSANEGSSKSASKGGNKNLAKSRSSVAGKSSSKIKRATSGQRQR